jgi:hypothetical protein
MGPVSRMTIPMDESICPSPTTTVVLIASQIWQCIGDQVIKYLGECHGHGTSPI